MSPRHASTRPTRIIRKRCLRRAPGNSIAFSNSREIPDNRSVQFQAAGKSVCDASIAERVDGWLQDGQERFEVFLVVSPAANGAGVKRLADRLVGGGTDRFAAQ